MFGLEMTLELAPVVVALIPVAPAIWALLRGQKRNRARLRRMEAQVMSPNGKPTADYVVEGVEAIRRVEHAVSALQETMMHHLEDHLRERV